MRPKPLRHTLIPAVLLAAPWLLLLAGGRPAWTDDRELLRFKSAKPFLFVLLDTSSSMNLTFGAQGQALQGDGDNPSSRIYGAKEALFEVFHDERGVHYGFAAMNQDDVAVTAKHWLYFPTQRFEEIINPATELPWAPDWPLRNSVDGWSFPEPPAGGRITQVVDDRLEYLHDHGGDVWTFGPRLRYRSSPPPGANIGDPVPAGSCTAPLPLGPPGSTERLRINRFARQIGRNPAASDITEMWIQYPTTGATSTYRMRFRRQGGKPQDRTLGESPFLVHVQLDRVTSCPGNFASPGWALEVLMVYDEGLNQYVMVDGQPTPDASSRGSEEVPGLWPTGGVTLGGSCGPTGPHAGMGMEPNFDTEKDQFCIGGQCVPLGRGIRPMQDTEIHPDFDVLDLGDILPVDWNRPHRNFFMQRLSPGWDPVLRPTPNFGIAAHLEDEPDEGTGAHFTTLAWQPPLVASGWTPINRAILDFRCWLQGGNPAKCGSSPYSDTWVATGCSADQDWGCRRTYFIVISDGVNTCSGESPAADTAGMWNRHNVRTWALNLGDPALCRSSGGGGELYKITQNSGPKGEDRCINVADREELKDQLRKLRGIIIEESRAFASAAVPSVQAVADQAIYLTNFTPLNEQPIWPGRVDAYVKPLPLTSDGKPDRDHENHVWDAAEVMVAEQYDATAPVGESATQRRVYYARASPAGGWSESRSLLRLPPNADGVDEDEEWYDLWRGFGRIEEEVATGSLTESQEAQHREAIERILFGTSPPGLMRLRTAQITNEAGDPETLSYLLGDIFHSDPLVLGQPVNTTYLNLNLHGDPTKECKRTDAEADGDRGYRCFFERHRYRRQVLLVGANDGMLHAFNLAQFRKPANEPGRYDHGTGHELFAYMPRAVMPNVAEQVGSDLHFYSVDGSPAAADVFIDPTWDGTGSPSANNRMWRTVAITGLREGGSALFALDVTQPDRLLDEVYLGGFLPDNDSTHLPTCMGAGDAASECGPLDYPAPLWEFTDSLHNSDLVGFDAKDFPPLRMDENFSGHPDLGATWSTPMIGRIRICGTPGGDCTELEPGDLEDRYVAIFGGGMDIEPKENKPLGLSGSWLYMVDVETGLVLYKRELLNPHDGSSAGSAPSQVAALDINGNGYLDRLYVGTTGGFLFRVDLAEPPHPFPGLETVAVNGIDRALGNHAATARRIARTYGDGSPAWEPRAIFDANWEEDGSPAPDTRSIFFRTAVIVAQNEGGLVLGFGTGDREDLWSRTPAEGRFYMIMDESGLVDPADLPFTDADYVRIDKGSPPTGENLLLNPPIGKRRGWFLALDPAERVISDSFSFLGITFFATYQPQVGLADEEGNPIEDNVNCTDDGKPFACCTGPGEGSCGERYGCSTTPDPNKPEVFCSRTGTSELFLVSALNADPLYPDLENEGERVRSRQVGTFVTTPYSEFTRGATGGDDATAGTADALTAADVALMEYLKSLFPPGCRFINARIDVHTIASDTRVEKLTSVPVCMQTTGWKEF